MGTLTVVLEGAMGIVPSEPLFTEENRETSKVKTVVVDRVVAVLPNLVEPGIASWGEKEKPALRGAHIPAIVFPMKSLLRSRSTRKLDLIFRDEGAKEDFGVVLLDHESVSFSYQLKGKRGVCCESTRGIGEGPITTDEEKSLWWVPRISEVSPEGAWMSGEYDPSRSKYPKKGRKVRATVLFENGHLSVAGYNQLAVGGKKVVWQFSGVYWDKDRHLYYTEHKKQWNKVIGNKLVVSKNFAGRTVDVMFISEDGMARIRLRTGWCKRNLSLSIFNVEPEVVISLQGRALHQTESYNPGDADFDPLYEICSCPTARRRVPVDESGGISNEGRACAPGLFEGFSR